MSKRTLISTNIKSEVVDIKNEPHLKLTVKGISHKKFTTNPSWGNQDTFEVYIPHYSIPYIMREERLAIANWEKNQTEFITRIKNAFNQEVKLPPENK